MILLRKALRAVLKQLCIIAINKHQLEIIAVGGWYGTDIGREAVYTILKASGKQVRRNIHTPNVDWDIPLAILGVKGMPTNIFSWGYTIIVSSIRLLFLKPNPSYLVLQINAQDAGIMKYWMSFITPIVVLMLNSHAGTLNLELLLVEKLKSSGYVILNNDNVRTKSLAQGEKNHVLYFGERSRHPDFYFDTAMSHKPGFVVLGHGDETYTLKKAFPEFVFPVLAAAVAISAYFTIPFADACASLDFFELPSDKIKKIFTKFIEE